MPPKKGAKKGKKGQDDDDAYWEQKAAELEAKQKELAAEDAPKAGSGGFGAFDMLDDEDEDGGGLMVRRLLGVSCGEGSDRRGPSTRRARKRTKSPRRRGRRSRTTRRSRLLLGMRMRRPPRRR